MTACALEQHRRTLAAHLGIEPACLRLPEDDPGHITRHASEPMPEDERQRYRDQQLARLRYDPEAVQARERRIAIESGRLAPLRRRA